LKAKIVENEDNLPGVQMVRQPIFDQSLKVVAYNLLYRSNPETTSLLFDNSTLAIRFLLDEYASVHESGTLRELPAVIEVPPESIRGDWNLGEDAHRVILDLVSPDDLDIKTILNIEKARASGHQISLTGFSESAKESGLGSLVDLVKLDVSNLTEKEIEGHLKYLREHSDAEVMAVNIQSVDSLEKCIELGFDLFQGNILSKPKELNDGKLRANESTVIRLIAELQNPDVTPEALEEIVVQDPVLAFKLLRSVNSAAYSLVREVTSISETIIMLGLQQVKHLAIIIGFNGQSGKPAELYRSLLIRSRACELVASCDGVHNGASFFLAGLMSGMHLVFDMEQKRLLEQSAVSDEIKAAVLGYEGQIGGILKNVMNYEAGLWDRFEGSEASIDIDVYDYAYRESIRWVNHVMKSVD